MYFDFYTPEYSASLLIWSLANLACITEELDLTYPAKFDFFVLKIKSILNSIVCSVVCICKINSKLYQNFKNLFFLF